MVEFDSSLGRTPPATRFFTHELSVSQVFGAVGKLYGIEFYLGNSYLIGVMHTPIY